MRSLHDLEAHLAAARQAFLRHVEELRPALHRYCTRMTGSALDGEDLVQETLATAYYKLSLLKQEVPLRAWLFTIAHHKCVDFLRAARPHDLWSPEGFDTGDVIEDPLERRAQVDAAFRHLLLVLPPAERACVVLKDVLDFTLEETAETLETTVGGVKSALHRGRQKLRDVQVRGAEVATSLRPGLTDRLAAFVDRFDARDWAGLADLLRADSQCEVVGSWAATGRDVIRDQYFTTYAGFEFPWRIAMAPVDGVAEVMCWQEVDGVWRPRSVIRVRWDGERIASLRDYAHIPYLFEDIQIARADAARDGGA